MLNNCILFLNREMHVGEVEARRFPYLLRGAHWATGSATHSIPACGSKSGTVLRGAVLPTRCQAVSSSSWPELHTQPKHLGESASELVGGSVPSAPGVPSKSVIDRVRGKWDHLMEGTEGKGREGTLF